MLNIELKYALKFSVFSSAGYVIIRIIIMMMMMMKKR